MPSAADIVDALEAYHPAPDWVTVPEAPNGKWSPRRCDLLALHSWQSRKFEVHGYEVKVSKSDWQHELDAPAKAESWWRFCDRWSLALPADGYEKILSAGDAPAGWGVVLVAEAGKRVRWLRKPELHDREPWPWPLMAVMLSTVDRRRWSGFTQAVARETAELQQRIRSLEHQAQDRRADVLQAKLDQLNGQIDLFERDSGLSIRGQRAFGDVLDPNVAQIVRVVRENFHYWSDLTHVSAVAAQMRREADRWDQVAAQLGLPDASVSRRAV